MRDLMIFAMMLIIVPLALRSTFSTYLLWGWAGIIALDTLAYGFMQSAKPVQTFAILTLLMYLANRDPEKQPFKIEGIGVLYVLFAFQGLVSATFAYPSLTRNWGLYSEILKTMLFILLMPSLVTSRLRVHAMVLAIALSAGFYGVIEGAKFISSGGAHQSQGVANLGDRNNFAVAIAMTIPLIIYLVWYSQNKLMRLAALGGAFINVLAVITTQSRAGLLSLIAIGLMIVLRSKRKFAGLVLVSLMAGMVVALAPADWSQRMNTIKTADEDSSFMGRVIAWKRATAIAVAHPVTGGGFRSVQDPVVFEKFRNDQGLMGFIDTPPAYYAAAAHSIYFEVLSDLGFIGMGLYMAIVLSPLFMYGRVVRLCKAIGPSYRWAADLMSMLNISLVAFLVGGASISAAYFEMAHIIIMLSYVLSQLVKKQHDQLKVALPSAYAKPAQPMDGMASGPKRP